MLPPRRKPGSAGVASIRRGARPAPHTKSTHHARQRGGRRHAEKEGGGEDTATAIMHLPPVLRRAVWRVRAMWADGGRDYTVAAMGNVQPDEAERPRGLARHARQPNTKVTLWWHAPLIGGMVGPGWWSRGSNGDEEEIGN